MTCERLSLAVEVAQLEKRRVARLRLMIDVATVGLAYCLMGLALVLL